MTRPGPPPPRGRHAAPDDARPDEDAPVGRHAADPARRRHAAPERDGYPEPTPRRRHAAPDDPPYGVPDEAPNGFTYHRPSIGHRRPEPGPNGSAPARPNGLGYRGPEPSPDGYAGPGAVGRDTPAPSFDGYRPADRNGPGDQGPSPNGYAGPGADGIGHHRAEPSPNGYPTPSANGVGYHRPGARPDGPAAPGANRYAAPGENGVGYHRPGARPDGPAAPGANRYAAPGETGVGYHRPGARPDGYAAPGANGYVAPGANGYAAPGADGGGYRRAEPGVGDPGADGVGYRRAEPGAHRYGGTEPAPQPWPEANGYHLETPAPPAVNGYRLDEPVAPVTGFPYTAPPSSPIAYPVDGHGVDAAERDAASWPVNGNATAWPIDGHPTELDRPLDPQIAAVPLEDEATEVLDRPAPEPAAGTQPKTSHPPRAVVRRRRARRKALEWPFLIVFAVVSAFLIRQYVVQTFYIPSASMHETLIEGDRVLVNKVGYHLHDIHRGDVVVFSKPPNLNVSEDDLIKRVVALPGETVEGRGGKVYVNGAPLGEPYVEPLCHGTGAFSKVTVPAGKLWVMGDNRCNSSDSRVFGPIDENLVVGRAFVLAWPFDRLSWL